MMNKKEGDYQQQSFFEICFSNNQVDESLRGVLYRLHNNTETEFQSYLVKSNLGKCKNIRIFTPSEYMLMLKNQDSNIQTNCSDCDQYLFQLDEIEINIQTVEEILYKSGRFQPVVRNECSHLFHLKCLEQSKICKFCSNNNPKMIFKQGYNSFKKIQEQQQQQYNPTKQMEIKYVQNDPSKSIDQQILNKIAQIKNTQKYKQSKINFITEIKPFNLLDYTHYLMKYTNNSGDIQFNEKCCICLCEYFDFNDQELKSIFDLQIKHLNDYYDEVIQLKCNHLFHLACAEQLVKENHYECPICKKIYGTKMGDQPDGTMSVKIEKNLKCQGYENFGTIAQIKDGIQYSGTYRRAYLPDNLEGNQVLKLLQKAFDRKLIFTLGTSVSTGQRNQTIWAGIHHKTNISGGPARFGYPDPTYLKRVKEELASRGVQ